MEIWGCHHPPGASGEVGHLLQWVHLYGRRRIVCFQGRAGKLILGVWMQATEFLPSLRLLYPVVSGWSIAGCCFLHYMPICVNILLEHVPDFISHWCFQRGVTVFGGSLMFLWLPLLHLSGDSEVNSTAWSVTLHFYLICTSFHVLNFSHAIFILKFHSFTCLCVYLKGATSPYETILMLTNYFLGGIGMRVGT